MKLARTVREELDATIANVTDKKVQALIMESHTRDGYSPPAFAVEQPDMELHPVWHPTDIDVLLWCAAGVLLLAMGLGAFFG